MASLRYTFQAGHEGSIPFARSNPKPQVRASISRSQSGFAPLPTADRATYVPHDEWIMPQLAISGASPDCADRTSRTRSPRASAIALSVSRVAC
jgi:hypothetical protein